MDFKPEYLEKLAKIINDNGLTEISMEDGNQAITVRKDLPEVVTAAVPAVAPAVSAAPSPAPSAEAKPEAKKGTPIVSPMDGMFYTKPSPDSEPFVKLGDEVAVGDTVCIVEAMKMMNEIEAEVAGKIVEICVADGEPVEYGQPLMYVE